MVQAWIEFALCAALIGIAGPALIRYGDAIAHATGLSRTWIGLTLIAAATSLPELFTGLSAVTIAASPNIAVGDALGSCVVNLAMLALVDALSRNKPVYGHVSQGHILTAGFGVVLIGLAGASVLLGRDHPGVGIAHVGVYTPVIVLVYFFAMRTIFVHEVSEAIQAPPDGRRHVGLSTAILRYAAAAAVVVAAGTWLPFAGLDIADAMGWRTTFVGTLIIAAATSLPELVVTISALRLGATDLAFASLLGSNLFDMLVIAIDDIAYLRGPLLADASPAHATTAFAAVIMSGIVIVALKQRPARRIRVPIGWASLALLLMYLLSSYAAYLNGN